LSYRLFASIWFVLWAALVSFEDIMHESVSLSSILFGSFILLPPFLSSPLVGAWFSVLAMCVFVLAGRITAAIQKREMLGGADIAFIGIAALYTGFWWAAITIGASVSCFFAFLCRGRRLQKQMCFVPFLAGAAVLCVSLRLGGVIPQLGGLI
jgi:hypothetical protein